MKNFYVKLYMAKLLSFLVSIIIEFLESLNVFPHLIKIFHTDSYKALQ